MCSEFALFSRGMFVKYVSPFVSSDSPYTILIPTDNAFQRWHPIDWGFYPFSVQEFTESVLRNHFLQMRQPLRLVDVQRMEHSSKYKTIGGEVVVFRSNRKIIHRNDEPW